MNENLDLQKLTTELLKNFQDTRQNKDEKIKVLSEMMLDIQELANNKHELYRERQVLISKKTKIINDCAEMQRLIKLQERNILNSQKFGQKIEKYPDSLVNAKNDYERKVYSKNYLKDLDYIVEIMNNFINYLDQCVNTVDKMLYGIPYCIQLETYKSSS